MKSRDFLKELQVLVLVGLAGTAIAVGVGVVQLLTGAPIQAEVFIENQPSIALPPGVVIDQSGPWNVEITAPTPRQRLLHGLAHAPTALLMLLALAQLALILRRARKTDPFTEQTVRSLYWTGLTLFGGLVAIAVESWAKLMLSETILTDRWGAITELPFFWLFGGLLCFAVAEVVKRGRVLRDELATVI